MLQIKLKGRFFFQIWYFVLHSLNFKKFHEPSKFLLCSANRATEMHKTRAVRDMMLLAGANIRGVIQKYSFLNLIVPCMMYQSNSDVLFFSASEAQTDTL